MNNESKCNRGSEKMENKNMYQDSIKQWNVYVGCHYDCVYCERSFKAQMKRQKHNCLECYRYEPHFHPERLDWRLPLTKGDEFIWACSAGDITFAKPEWIEAILEKIREMPTRTFLMQTKDPACYTQYDLPDNLLIDITLETNRDEGYKDISKAPLPSIRYHDYLEIDHPHKLVTVEPILDFDSDIFLDWIRDIEPIRVYIGYDSKKNRLPEPELDKTKVLISSLDEFVKIKTKFLRSAWWE